MKLNRKYEFTSRDSLDRIKERLEFKSSNVAVKQESAHIYILKLRKPNHEFGRFCVQLELKQMSDHVLIKTTSREISSFGLMAYFAILIGLFGVLLHNTFILDGKNILEILGLIGLVGIMLIAIIYRIDKDLKVYDQMAQLLIGNLIHGESPENY